MSLVFKETLEKNACVVFVGTDLWGALDLLSNVLRNKSNAGAIFLSSMFAHSTSTHIWVDDKALCHLRGPKEMHNFA